MKVDRRPDWAEWADSRPDRPTGGSIWPLGLHRVPDFYHRRQASRVTDLRPIATASGTFAYLHSGKIDPETWKAAL